MWTLNDCKKSQVAGLNKIQLERDSNNGSNKTAFGKFLLFRFFQIGHWGQRQSKFLDLNVAKKNR